MPSRALGVLLLALMACNLPLAAAPTVIPTNTPIPTATNTPTPVPTPRPANRLQAAERALVLGDWDLAVEEYERALSTADEPAILEDAALGLAIAHGEAENVDQAIRLLAIFIETYTESDQLAEAHFRRARLHEGAEHPRELIVEHYERYLELRPGVLDAYVLEWVGDAHRREGFPQDALAAYERARVAPRLGGSAPVEVKIGRAYLSAGRYEQAIATFEALYQELTDPFSRATLNLLMGEAHTELGDLASAHARYQDSVANYPEAYNSYLALIELVNAGVAVDELRRGIIDYNAGAYEPALAALDRSLAEQISAEGHYYRGLTRRALGDNLGALEDFGAVASGFVSETVWPEAVHDKALTEWAYLENYEAAIQTYLAALQADPEGEAAAEMHFDVGRVAERSGQLNLAAELWSQAASQFPQSAYGYQSAFEAGIVLFRAGDSARAHASFLTARELARNESEQAASNLWIGKALHAQGMEDQAALAWREAAAADPTGYYSVRAGQLLAGVQPFEPAGLFDFTYDEIAERTEAESWLREAFAIPADRSLEGLDAVLAADGRLQRGDEFWALGMYDLARGEYEALREELSGDPEATYRLMHHFLERGAYRQAILAARRVLALAGMDDAATMSAPVYFNRVRFGPYFADIILPEALRAGLDGLLLTSVVRQESLFAANAVSFAAARGLMQIIPSTGQAIANELLWPPDYDEDDLYRPLVSVRLGTHYLAQQRDRFDGDLYAALAAYNAGPGNSFVWKSLAPDDPDLYLEVVRFTQTHTYIRTIFEVFDIYQRLYVQP